MTATREEVRRDKLLKLLKKTGADTLLVSNASNVTYLSGFTGHDTWLVLSPRECIAISDGRYTTQLEEECPRLPLSIRPVGSTLATAAAKVLGSTKGKRIGFEADSVTVAMHAGLAEPLPNVAWLPISGLVEELRQIKDQGEIDEIRLAIRQAQRAFAVLRATLRGDQTEKQVADDLEHRLRLLGARGSSFDPIVAVGPRAALPHATPGRTPISAADFVLIDWGATACRYRSDLTRVLVTGKISPKLEKVYGVVLRAQRAAIAAIRPGVLACEVDAAARSVIDSAGFGRNFSHGLGHGVGLDIHEAPRMSATNNRPLVAGMVITVEPGVYLPGWGGVRIEDDVLVTRGGHEVLSDLPRELEESQVSCV